ncbi:selina-4(15),7(11)-diene synthase [Streptomyces sp. NPDC057910]|uniref:selina-4(15),7(11)-diene synthase n=1 Tax=Streptomyces sp. NPDC057910 TaxID=3346278 RepID=UPI0036EE6563
MTGTHTHRKPVHIPPPYIPFPAALHPDHETIDREAIEWAEKLDLGTPKLRARIATRSQVGKFAASMLPHGEREVVRLLADFIFWLFIFDDDYCEEGELGTKPGDLTRLVSQLLRAAQNHDIYALRDDPMAAGLRDLRSRIDQCATPGQSAKWVNSLREYFLSVVWEADYRKSGSVPTLDDYTALRLYSSAIMMLPVWFEMGLGIEVHPLEADHRAVQAVNEMAAFIAAWDNDMISYHKESRGEDYYVNAVRVLQQEHGFTTDETVAELIRQRDRVLMLYRRVTAELRTWGSPQLRQYLGFVDVFIRSVVEWQLACPRYSPPEDPADLPSGVRDNPTTTDSPQPLPIPTIAWWWDLDPAGRADGGTQT